MSNYSPVYDKPDPTYAAGDPVLQPSNSRVIPLTDHRGRKLVPADDLHEPLPSSVILTEGLHGTAWQRLFSDGRWHPTRGGGSKSWEQLLAKRNVVLVYDADERGAQR